jgi:hypothetical protein
MRTVFSWTDRQAHDIKKDIKQTGYQNRWTKLAQNRVQWWVLVLAVLLNVRFVLAVTEPLVTALCNSPPRFQKDNFVLEGFKLRRFVVVVRATCR